MVVGADGFITSADITYHAWTQYSELPLQTGLKGTKILFISKYVCSKQETTAWEEAEISELFP